MDEPNLAELLQEIAKKSAELLGQIEAATKLLRLDNLPMTMVMEANDILPRLALNCRDAEKKLPLVVNRLQTAVVLV